MPQSYSDEFLTAFLDGQLSGEEMLRAEDLLRNDEHFRKQVSEWRQISNRFQQLPRKQLGVDFRGQIMAKIAEELATPERDSEKLETLPRSGNVRRSTFHWRRLAGVFSTVAALLVVSFMLMPQRFSRWIIPSVSNEAKVAQESANRPSTATATSADRDRRADSIQDGAGDAPTASATESDEIADSAPSAILSLDAAKPQDPDAMEGPIDEGPADRGAMTRSATGNRAASGDSALRMRAWPSEEGGAEPSRSPLNTNPPEAGADGGGRSTRGGSPAASAETREPLASGRLANRDLPNAGDDPRSDAAAKESTATAGPSNRHFVFSGQMVDVPVDEAWYIAMPESPQEQENLSRSLKSNHFWSDENQGQTETEGDASTGSANLNFILVTSDDETLYRSLVDIAKVTTVAPVDTGSVFEIPSQERREVEEKALRRPSGEPGALGQSVDETDSSGVDLSGTAGKVLGFDSAQDLNRLANRNAVTPDLPDDDVIPLDNVAFLGKQTWELVDRDGQLCLVPPSLQQTADPLLAANRSQEQAPMPGANKLPGGGGMGGAGFGGANLDSAGASPTLRNLGQKEEAAAGLGESVVQRANEMRLTDDSEQGGRSSSEKSGVELPQSNPQTVPFERLSNQMALENPHLLQQQLIERKLKKDQTPPLQPDRRNQAGRARTINALIVIGHPQSLLPSPPAATQRTPPVAPPKPADNDQRN